MSNVLVKEASLQAIANSIRAKNGSTDTYKPGDMAAAIDGIEGGGLPKEFEWVNCISSGSIVTDMTSFEDETVILTYPSGTYFNFNAFPNYTLKHLTLNFSKRLGNCNKMFFSFGQVNANEGAYALERITLNADTSKAPNFANFIRSMNWTLTTIDGTPLDFSSATTIGVFCNRCFGLAYIRIVQNTIKVDADFSGSYSWDDESLDSIVYGLAKVEETNTLKLHTDVTLRLTEAQWTLIESKNWQVM